MNDLTSRYGDWALIAGAAEGLGESFSTALACRGFNLILVDWNRDKLESLADSLRKMPGGKKKSQECIPAIRVIALQLDLSTPEAAELMMEQVRSTGCRLMIYVAAFSKVCDFTSLTPDDIDGFIDTNNRTLLHLVHRFSIGMTGKGQAGILLISSLAGIVGIPLVSSYAATKGFIKILGEALHNELKPAGIDVTVCCAGITETPMFLSTKPTFGLFKPQIQKPAEVTSYALKMLGKKAICISGAGNRSAIFLLTRLLPRRLAGKLVARNIRAMYR